MPPFRTVSNQTADVKLKFLASQTGSTALRPSSAFPGLPCKLQNVLHSLLRICFVPKSLANTSCFNGHPLVNQTLYGFSFDSLSQLWNR